MLLILFFDRSICSFFFLSCLCGLFVFCLYFFSFPFWFHVGHTVDDSISKKHSVLILLISSARRLAQDSITLPGGPCDLGSSPGSSLPPCADQDP